MRSQALEKPLQLSTRDDAQDVYEAARKLVDDAKIPNAQPIERALGRPQSLDFLPRWQRVALQSAQGFKNSPLLRGIKISELALGSPRQTDLPAGQSALALPAQLLQRGEVAAGDLLPRFFPRFLKLRMVGEHQVFQLGFAADGQHDPIGLPLIGEHHDLPVLVRGFEHRSKLLVLDGNIAHSDHLQDVTSRVDTMPTGKLAGVHDPKEVRTQARGSVKWL